MEKLRKDIKRLIIEKACDNNTSTYGLIKTLEDVNRLDLSIFDSKKEKEKEKLSESCINGLLKLYNDL